VPHAHSVLYTALICRCMLSVSELTRTDDSHRYGFRCYLPTPQAISPILQVHALSLGADAAGAARVLPHLVRGTPRDRDRRARLRPPPARFTTHVKTRIDGRWHVKKRIDGHRPRFWTVLSVDGLFWTALSVEGRSSSRSGTSARS
jgi:hypothetical protein